MDISMDIHAKSVDMDGKFHIHGNPDNHGWCRPIYWCTVLVYWRMWSQCHEILKKVIYPGQCTQCADRLRWMSFEVVTAIACRHWRRGRPRMTAGHTASTRPRQRAEITFQQHVKSVVILVEATLSNFSAMSQGVKHWSCSSRGNSSVN